MDELTLERSLAAQGFLRVAGVDEVGRGPLAGPVVCAAVVLPFEEERRILGIDDSKKLSAKKRQALAEKIKTTARAYAVAEVDASVIDEINILQLLPAADMVLTDGNMTLDISIPQRSIIRGDALVCSIGAASILAKVHRDALMAEYAKLYPEYAFERNAGYGTKAHIEAIREVGICPIHRRTFITKFWDGKERHSSAST